MGLDRREALEKAFDAVESDEKEETTQPDKEGEGAELEAKVEDEQKTDKEDGTPEGEQKPEGDDADTKEREAAARVEQKPEGEQKPVVTDRAPNSWKPAVREHWAKLPSEVRAEVSRREKEILQGMSQVAQIRKFGNDFAQVIGPYSHLIRAQNSTPLQAVSNLMQTAAGLTTGSQEQKAAIISDIIHNYKVDLKMLDQVLSQHAQNPPAYRNRQQPTNEAPPAWAQPIFSFMTEVQTARERREQEGQEKAAKDIEQFQDHPFFDDLREDIADILEMAANRNRTLTMEQAYKIAIDANPEIKKIIDQRAAATRNANGGDSRITRARRAAKTISSAPKGDKVGGKLVGGTRKEALEAAWEEQSR